MEFQVFNSLSKVQHQAVTTTEGSLLVFAGAGSGKTRVITYRIAYLLKKLNVLPEHILAVTFTNKAAKEMKERIKSLVNNEESAKKLTIATFHSLGLQILKKEHKAIDYPSNFVIYSPYEVTELLKKVMAEKNISTERFSPRSMASIISDMKNNPDKYQSAAIMIDPKKGVARKLYDDYAKALKLQGAMDFDDLILKCNELFGKNDEIRKKYASQYKYIMVDEYQDTNSTQYQMIRYLTSVHNNLCVVGDDDQSIYSWRGAKVENILNFQRDYPGCTVVKLEENYRSIEPIVNAAGRLISFNRTRAEKKVFTTNEASPEDGIFVSSHIDEDVEAEFVASKILELKVLGASFGSSAILVRANAQTRPFEIAFNKAKVPYKIIGGQKFFENKEIKDITAYLRILVNSHDEISLRRIINYPSRGIGDTTLQKLFETSAEKKISSLNMLKNIGDIDGLKTAQRESLYKFKLIYDDLIENLKEFVNSVAYHLEGKKITSGRDFYSDFINSITLISTGEEELNNQTVSIITVHSSKGLEFETVFLVGFYNGGFPNKMAIEEGNIEEERRLAYVAITRAKTKLYITIPETVKKMGKTEVTVKSMFLDETGLSSKFESSISEPGSRAELIELMMARIRKQ